MNFTDQRERLRRIIHNAIDGASYESSRPEEDGRLLLLEGRRRDGTTVYLRFRGVRSSDATAPPQSGSALRLQSVGSATGFSLLAFFFPFARRAGSGAARVRIDAGTTRLDIVCEDAEWWSEANRPSGI